MVSSRHSGTLEGPRSQGRATETIPGTQFMKPTNVNGDHIEYTLVPQPSRDPSDPLNWSPVRKGMAISAVYIYTFVTTTAALAMAPMFPMFGETFDLSLSQEALITGVTVITLGYSNFLVIPFSNTFGRRAACLLFGVLFFATCIWEAVATSYSSFMASRVIVGLAAAPSETLMVQVIADMFFLHERGLWMGLYFSSLFLGGFIGPVISGNIAQRCGWRNFFWLSAGLIAFDLILIIFLFPETRYHNEIQNRQPGNGSLPEVQKSEELSSAPCSYAEHVEGVEASSRIRGRPCWKQFLPIQTPHPRWKSFVVQDFFAPFRVAFYPIVVFGALNLAGPANLVLFWNLVESEILTAPKYGFTASQVGYSNFAFAAGAVVGLLTAGSLSDWMVKRATDKNGGLREAEMRLPALTPYLISLVLGTVIGGLATSRGWPWPVIVIFGFGFTGLAVTSIPTICIAYAVDSYKAISGEIMIVGTVFKNTTGFGMAYWLPPMLGRVGYITPLMIAFTLTVAPILAAIPLYFYGKKLRVATRDSSVHGYESEW